jgi:RNA polymerase sigma-70 factor (ECF subfamily)
MARQQPTEEELIERARGGDRRSQQELWCAHRRWVAAIVLAHRPRAIEVDDLMQEVAVKFVSKIQTLREAAAFRPWLRQIVINICRGAARSHRPTLHLAEDTRSEPGETEIGRVSTPPTGGDGPGQSIARRDAARRLLEQALTLPPEYREPLLLRCIRSLTYQQIGTILDMPVTTVETRLARARRMLREEIGAELSEWGPDSLA